NPACYYNFTIGDIDFIMLDCRFYRTNPFKEKRTMLGTVQKEWLKQSLLKSKGKFKFIVSSVPWSLKAKPGSKDTWAGFEKEREEIFEFIEQNKIEGVILISADRHRSDAWKIDRKNSYDFYEFMSSRLTNIHTHKLMPDALFGYNEKCSFGLLDINTSDDDPNVVYKTINLDGEVIDSLTVKSSMLKFK
ncbi:MAG: alkaline phosphatase, partial [Chlorobi bacterium]|nr:alkaline phosphatase [Chlorobiota bacterium]